MEAIIQMETAKIKSILNAKKKKYTQAEIARKLGVTPAYISYLLNNKRNNPSLLEKIKEIIKNADN